MYRLSQIFSHYANCIFVIIYFHGITARYQKEVVDIEHTSSRIELCSSHEIYSPVVASRFTRFTVNLMASHSHELQHLISQLTPSAITEISQGARSGPAGSCYGRGASRSCFALSSPCLFCWPYGGHVPFGEEEKASEKMKWPRI